MVVEQISVFLENKAGRLSEVTTILAQGGVNISALSLADTSDFGILRLIVDNPEKANELLKANNITVRTSEVLSVDVEDIPGGLNNTVVHLTKHGVNIEYMYAFVQKRTDKATLVFRTSNLAEAQKALELLK